MTRGVKEVAFNTPTTLPKASKRLRFEFESKILSGEPIDLQSNPLSPGDAWVGPHPGIPYKLKAGGKDIEYSFSPRPNVEKNCSVEQGRSQSFWPGAGAIP